MLVSATERAIVVALLALQHSSTSLRLYLDIRENVASSIKSKVLELLDELEDEREKVESKVNDRWENTI